MGFFSFKALFFKIYINILLEKSFKTKKRFLQKRKYFERYGKMKFLPESFVPCFD